MRLRTEAIVLNARPYGEADLVVRFFTREEGLADGFAKSPRKIRSRFGAAFEPLTHLRLTLLGREGNALPRIVQADILQAFQALRDSLATLMRISATLHPVTALLHEREPHPRKFDLLRAALAGMERTGRIDLFDTAFRIKFLWMAGYGPRVDGCGRCGRSFRGGYGIFYPVHGALICRGCVRGEEGRGVRLDREAVRYFGEAKARTFDALVQDEPGEEVLAQVRAAVDAFVTHLTGRPAPAGGGR